MTSLMTMSPVIAAIAHLLFPVDSLPAENTLPMDAER
jgi:hypothetical protein